MLLLGLLDMIAGFGLAGISTQAKKNNDKIEQCAAACLVSGCMLVGTALPLVW